MNEYGKSLRETAAFLTFLFCETLQKWKVAYETQGLDTLNSKKKGPEKLAKWEA